MSVRISSKRTPFAPRHEYYKQGTPEWLAARRIVTASSAAGKAGISSKTNVGLENEAARKGWKLETTRPMLLGHANENAVSVGCVKLLAPLPGMLLDVPEVMEEVGLFTHPESEKWLSASPDRVFHGHPYSRVCSVLIEAKFSEKTIYSSPSVEYIVQTQIQMYTTGSEFAFLVYGHGEGTDMQSVVVYLVEYCPELMEWIMPRLKEFADSIAENRNCRNMQIGEEVKSLWSGYPMDKDFFKKHPECVSDTNFWPPQPRWQLVGWNVNYGASGFNNIGGWIARRSKTSQSVSEEVFEHAIGWLWRRVNVSVKYSTFETPLGNDIKSLHEQTTLAFSRGIIDEEEAKVVYGLIKDMKIKQLRSGVKQDYAFYFEDQKIAEIKALFGGNVKAASPYIFSFMEGIHPASLDPFLKLGKRVRE